MKFKWPLPGIALSLFISHFSLQAQDTTRVLFIGNSLTYVNDLTTVFKNLSIAGGHFVITDQSVFGGYTLAMQFPAAKSLGPGVGQSGCMEHPAFRNNDTG